MINNHPILEWAKDSKLIMLTAHRRENLGQPNEKICLMLINRILNEFEDVKVVYPIHKNPKVRELASKVFGDNERMKIIEPLEVIDFHNFMNQSYMILTDSGGVQEEAPSLGKPVLVMRDTTERPEGIADRNFEIGRNRRRKYFIGILSFFWKMKRNTTR